MYGRLDLFLRLLLLLLFSELLDERDWIECLERRWNLSVQIVLCPQLLPEVKKPVESEILSEVSMTEFHLTFSTSSQLHFRVTHCFLLALDLLFQTVVAVNMLTRQPLWILCEDASAYRTLELSVHEFILHG